MGTFTTCQRKKSMKTQHGKSKPQVYGFFCLVSKSHCWHTETHANFQHCIKLKKKGRHFQSPSGFLFYTLTKYTWTSFSTETMKHTVHCCSITRDNSCNRWLYVVISIKASDSTCPIAQLYLADLSLWLEVDKMPDWCGTKPCAAWGKLDLQHASALTTILADFSLLLSL